MSFRVIDPFASAGGTVPTVSFVSPSPGAAIETNDPIVVDVVDEDTADLSVFLFAALSNGAQEVVWDGSAFALYYSGSTRAAIANGYRYTIRRNAGWPNGPVSIKANAIDDTGGIAT